MPKDFDAIDMLGPFDGNAVVASHGAACTSPTFC
jgi:hypothetical protein